MRNFSINFTTSPWLLFLLIPAIALALWPYFRMSKRFRRTRNRVCSLVLHIIILVLCVCLLSGMQFSYETNDSKNEMVLLVDLSFSSEEDSTIKEERDEFIRDLLDANHRQCKIGIVTFGYTQVKAADPSFDTAKVLEQYEKAPLPDTSATDIASALRSVWNPREDEGIFKDPAHGKIVLISDGLETDGDAMALVQDLAADGVRVDTVCFSPRQKYDVQVTGITLPERDIEVDKEFEVTFNVQTSVTGTLNFTMVDEYSNQFGESQQEIVPPKTQDMTMDLKSVTFKHTFKNSGLHKLYLQMESEQDSITFNNQYYAYYELFVHDKVLLIERYEDESESLNEILNKDLVPIENEFNVTKANITDPESLPKTLNQLREFDQVILVNVSHEDMPQEFEDNLYQYVREYGGGLFTVGGYERDEYNEVVMDTATKPVAHSYVRSDMKGSRFQELLPVNIDSYTPPIAVLILIDISKTMSETSSSGMTRLELAKRAALSCLDAMNTRDYCGIGVFDGSYQNVLALTPAAQRIKLENAINIVSGSTNEKFFSDSISRAAQTLYSSSGDIENKHIIMLTDGTMPDPQSEPQDTFYNAVRRIYDRYGVTMSIAGIDLPAKGSIPLGDMNPYNIYQDMADFTNSYFYASSDIAQMADYMVEDLRQSTLVGVTPNQFTPQISSRTAAVTGVNADNMPRMGGYFVSRAKTTGNVQVALTAESVPLYAQWDFGKGRVGSFMCDLGAYFGMNFVESSEGIKILNNIVHDLMPGEDIRSKEVDAVLLENNYSTTVSIYTDLEEGQTLEWRVDTKPWTGAEGTGSEEGNALEGIILSGGAKRFTFTNLDAGIYTITIVKKDETGAVLASLTTYRNFSYSKEYDVFRNTDEGVALMTNLAANGNGKVVESVPAVYDNFVDLVEVFDPRILFMILAIILFLLDVAVRKFKFKWPHELIRAYKEKKNGTSL